MALDGFAVGSFVALDGFTVGRFVALDGFNVGRFDGFADGRFVGRPVGFTVAFDDVGKAVCLCDGIKEGTTDGHEVGVTVNPKVGNPEGGKLGGEEGLRVFTLLKEAILGLKDG